MLTISDQTFDAERALYGSRDLEVVDCAFDGPADGESAFKECANITVRRCFMNLRYPFWHVDGLTIEECELTGLCRAALWYSHGIRISQTKLHGIKALRESSDVMLDHCDIVSPEFGWSTRGIKAKDCEAASEYFLMRAADIHFKRVKFAGKYSFQYIEHALFENCEFDTKDAFWHGRDIVVRDSVVKGEYLGWYSEGLTFENCTIIGTQPLCYCKDLRLVNCTMIDSDLAFEKSTVEAIILNEVASIKNPRAGRIRVPSLGELIMDDPAAEGVVEVG